MDYKKYVRDVPDYPKPGIIFKDITPMLKDQTVFSKVVLSMAEKFRGAGIHKLCGIESRGFIFGAPLALELNAGFIPARKEGKLPAARLSQEYMLEYGTSKIEIHTDAIERGEKILIVDDVLATGGTAEAVCNLIERMGGQIVGLAFFIELNFLNGRKKFPNQQITSLIQY